MHMDWIGMARFWQWEGYTRGFCQNLLEVSPLPNGASAWLQDGSATGVG